MPASLLNIFILVCKLMTCLTFLVAFNSNYWARSGKEGENEGLFYKCTDYGQHCYRTRRSGFIPWFFYCASTLNLSLELANLLSLCKRPRSRINLILEELMILITLVLMLVTVPSGWILLALDIHYRAEHFDWSFKVFLLATVLVPVELICSLVRVVSYCRHHSFRSNPVAYTSANQGTVDIQA